MEEGDYKRCGIIEEIADKLEEKFNIVYEVISNDTILINISEYSLIDKNPWKGDIADVYEVLEQSLEKIIFYIRDEFNFDADYDVCGDYGIEIQILF